MATTTSITSTYAGEHAGEWISAMLNEAASLNHITVKENIKHKRVVKKLADTVSFADETCDFTPTGTVTVTERILAPERLELNKQLCKKDLVSDWNALEMGFGRNSESLPSSVEEYFISHQIAGAGAALETIIWQGVTATAGEFDGIETNLLADADVNDVATPVALSAANIVSKMEASLDVLGSAVLGAQEKPAIYMGVEAVRFYRRAMFALGYLDQYYAGNIPLVFDGFEIKECPGMSDDTIVVAQPSNLWFGTDLLSDLNEVGVKDMSDQGEQNVRFWMQFSGGTQHGIGGDIALYQA